MARSNAATVDPPARRRKPAPARHATTQTPRPPARRTSGPAKGRAATPKKRVAPATRRAATVARPAARPRRKPAAAPRPAPVVRRIAEGRGGALVDHLLRGRVCVGVVFVLLVGIVFFNVSLLQMNEGIARTNAQATALEQENAKLRGTVAPLASTERIQREAVKRGFSLPAAGDVGYIRGTLESDAKRAAGRMTAPGIGTGTASRPAAEVQDQAVAGDSPTTGASTTTPAPAPTAATPPPVTPAPTTQQATPVAPSATVAP